MPGDSQSLFGVCMGWVSSLLLFHTRGYSIHAPPASPRTAPPGLSSSVPAAFWRFPGTSARTPLGFVGLPFMPFQLCTYSICFVLGIALTLFKLPASFMAAVLYSVFFWQSLLNFPAFCFSLEGPQR